MLFVRIRECTCEYESYFKIFSDTTSTSSNLSWSCDFESEVTPLCGMQQEMSDDQFDWTHQSGRTPSGATGPMEAYDGQYYVYIEASDPRQPGDSAA